MKKNEDILKNSSHAIKEIEEQLENILTTKKEDAEKKLQQIKEEIDKRREALANFETQVAELETHKAALEGKIRDHLDKAFQYQKEIEKLAQSKLNELTKMDELDQKIGEHRQQAEEKTTELKQGLEEKFGLEASPPKTEKSDEKVKGSIEEELNKLGKIKELLGLAEAPPAEEVKTEEKATKEEMAEEITEEFPVGVEMKEEAKPEEIGVEEVKPEAEIVEESITDEKVEEEAKPKQEDIEDVFQEEKAEEEVKPEEEVEEAAQPEEIAPKSEAPTELLETEESGLKPEGNEQIMESSAPEDMIFEEEPLPGQEKEEEAIKEDVSFQAPPEEESDMREKIAQLETLKKSESVAGEDQIVYYQGEKKTLIDGRSLFAAIDGRIQQARDLYQNLDPSSPPKDQFKTKQEIRNSQENLRKLFLRTIDMFEKESFSLPEFSSDVLNINTLKDILEHLSMLNWSNEDNFGFFNDRIDKMKRNFYSKITPHEIYSKSIYEELNA